MKEKYIYVVGYVHQGRQHRVHPPPVLGRQRCGMHYGGGPLQCGGVQSPLERHTHQGDEGN